MRAVFPRIRMSARPDRLKLRAPKSAVMHYDASIRSAVKADNEIEILGEIMPPEFAAMFGGTSAKTVKDRLKEIGKAPVLVTINSPGGDAFEGIAIYNMLRDHGAKISVDVLGMAASAASIVAMAGDTIRMAEATKMMIHSSHGIVVGNQDDMREFAELLDGIDSDAAALYAARTGNSQDKVLAMMKKETWMNGEQAVEHGFADSADKKKKPKSATTQPIFASVSPALLAASGDRQRPVVRLSATLPGASGSQHNRQGIHMRTIAEQLSAYESKRAASDARMSDIMQKAADAGVTLDATQTEEYDTLDAEVKAIDAHIIRLKAHEKQVLARATPITPAAGADPEAGTRARAVSSDVIALGPKIEPGIPFARAAIALFLAKGNRTEAAHIFGQNKRWMDQTPGIQKVLMTAVPAADSTTAGWASELAYAQNMQDQFIEFLRPMTILGRLNSTRRVPFNVRMSSLTSGTTGYWVGQGKAIPMSKGATGSLSLGITKAAGLAAYDDEILKLSTPSIETMVRDDLAKAVAQVVDIAFIDPNNGGITNEKPASLLYGVTPITPSGTNAAAVSTDVAAVFAASIAANLDPMSGVWIMSPTTALKLSLMMTTQGTAQYPSININGGTWQGLRVIVSPNATIAGSPQFGNMIVLLLQNEILVADDGGVDIQISNEASFEMLDNPTNLSTGGTAATAMVSMFQTQSWAIKAVRYVNWTKRRTAAAAYIQAAAYA